jgi:hypothetical protein
MPPAFKNPRREVVKTFAAGSADAGGAVHLDDCPLAGQAWGFVSLGVTMLSSYKPKLSIKPKIFSANQSLPIRLVPDNGRDDSVGFAVKKGGPGVFWRTLALSQQLRAK